MPLINLEAEAWYYNSLEGTQGPVSLSHLASHKATIIKAGWWPLRVRLADQKEEDAIPITSLLPPEWR